MRGGSIEVVGGGIGKRRWVATSRPGVALVVLVAGVRPAAVVVAENVRRPAAVEAAAIAAASRAARNASPPST